MTEPYILASFRSRQAVLRLEAQLKSMGIPSEIVSTPRKIAIGCGLSVSFPREKLGMVKGWVSAGNTSTLIGFYEVKNMNGFTDVMPVSR